MVAIVGSGLAGLVAAIEAQAAGADVVVLERRSEPGGATADSAGWIWRYRDAATARVHAPSGDDVIRQLVVDSLDADLEWLVRQGVSLRAASTGRALTVGAQVDPAAVVELLAAHVDLRVGAEVVAAHRRDDGRIELTIHGQPPQVVDAVVFAGGGYAGNVDRVADEAGVSDATRAAWVLRARAAGNGSSIDAALGLGGSRVPATGESLVRLVPSGGQLAVGGGHQLVRMGELQVPGTTLLDHHGRVVEQPPHDWSGAVAGWTLARTSGEGQLVFDARALATRLHAGGTVDDAIRIAVQAGARTGRTRRGDVWLAVRAGITATRCGLRVDAAAQLVASARGRDDAVVPRAFAAGLDVADPGMGGMHSGLALALVLGRRAGRAAATHGNSR